jgi:hypothetical protein
VSFQLKELFESFVTSIVVEKNCTRAQADSFAQNIASVRAMGFICGILKSIPKVSNSDATLYFTFDDSHFGTQGQLRLEFDTIMNDSRELQLVAQWLRAIQVPIEVELPHDLESRTLDGLKAVITEFQEGLGLPEETLKSLRFFIPRKSMLFEAIATKYLKQMEYDVRQLFFLLFFFFFSFFFDIF